MSKTTTKERKSRFSSNALKNIVIYSLCLIFGFVLTFLGFKPTRPMFGYILMGAVGLTYFAMSYLIWGKLIPYLDTARPRNRKQTFYKKAHQLKASLKKNFLLITLLLVGIVLFALLTQTIEAMNNKLLLNIVCFLFNGCCVAYTVNVLDALFAYTIVKEMREYR